MAAYRYIDDFSSGDTYILDRYITTLSGYNLISDAWWTVKEATNVSDANAEFSLHVTTSGSTHGQIIKTNDYTQLHFIASSSDTTPLYGLETYFYDIQVKLSNDYLYTIEVGKLFTYNTVTQGS